MSRRCARPGCGQPADTTLSFAYDQRQVWLDDLWADDSPANHDLSLAMPTGPNRLADGNCGIGGPVSPVLRRRVRRRTCNWSMTAFVTPAETACR